MWFRAPGSSTRGEMAFANLGALCHLATMARDWAGAGDSQEAAEAAQQRAKYARLSKKCSQLERDLVTANEQKQTAQEQVALCTSLNDDCRRLLGKVAERVSDAHLDTFTKMWAMQRLACSPRCGNGPAQRRQDLARELVAKASLRLQKYFFQNMLEAAASVRASTSAAVGPQDVGCRSLQPAFGPGGGSTAFLGLRICWDEASHHMRALFTRTGSEIAVSSVANSTVQVMTACCDLTCVVAKEMAGGHYISLQRWEPWLCPPRPLAKTSTDYVLHAVITTMPFEWDSHNSMQAVLAACDGLIVVMLCDSASSNLKALRWFAYTSLRYGIKILWHPEVCFVHQCHIARSNSLELVGCAGTLYSLSKILRHSSALDSLKEALLIVVSKSAVVRFRR